MANKPRTPDPPRRVQAPKQRQAATPAENRARWILFVSAGLGIVGLIAAVSLFAFGGSNGSGSVVETLEAAGCTFRTVDSPPHAGDHSDVPTPTSEVEWNTDPPSNGAHYQQWAVWDWYDEAVQPQLLVHNQEHGGMIVWWGDEVPAEQVDQMHEWYLDDPDSIVGTPFPSLGNKIALTAWTGNPATYFENGDYGQGRIAVCPRFDEDAFEAFKDEFRGKGPERIPIGENAPGST
jgi:hypothetical protein